MLSLISPICSIHKSVYKHKFLEQITILFMRVLPFTSILHLGTNFDDKLQCLILHMQLTLDFTIRLILEIN